MTMPWQELERPATEARMNGGAGIEPDLTRQELHDAANAERLLLLKGDSLRFCHPMRKWLVWDGRRWAVDVREQAVTLAKATMALTLNQSIMARNEALEKFARRSLDFRRLQSMLALAQSELAILPEELDRDADLLNFSNGTLNLKTGELRQHRQRDHLTKLVHFDYRPGAKCGRFLAFISRIMGVDGVEGAALDRALEKANFLQTALGYSMTGHTREKAVFIPLGSGNNGKTTLLSLVAALLPEYSASISVESLMLRNETVNSQADLADLRGARFVTTSEVEDGQTLAQARLKRLTQGGGRIKAVRKYENPIEFSESHKLWMDSNRRPRVRDVEDRATFARLWPIPFDVEIPASEIDPELPAKLMAEAEGILAWLVAGARAWYQHGLERPRDVDEARTAWREDDDAVGRFVDECCVVVAEATARGGVLYRGYVNWAERGREHPLSNPKFSKRLESKGFKKDRDESGARWFGIGLREQTA
jgi:putative DNA primase/helicase